MEGTIYPGDGHFYKAGHIYSHAFSYLVEIFIPASFPVGLSKE
jgi:hypothetical protein